MYYCESGVKEPEGSVCHCWDVGQTRVIISVFQDLLFFNPILLKNIFLNKYESVFYNIHKFFKSCVSVKDFTKTKSNS